MAELWSVRHWAVDDDAFTDRWEVHGGSTLRLSGRRQVDARHAGDAEMSEWKAEWTGEYPNLCSGEFRLYRDGERVPGVPFGECGAGTRGTYDTWSFDPDWTDVWDTYEDGLEEGEWIEEHRPWLATIADEADFPKVYRALQSVDFRPNSCGGCI